MGWGSKLELPWLTSCINRSAPCLITGTHHITIRKAGEGSTGCRSQTTRRRTCNPAGPANNPICPKNSGHHLIMPVSAQCSTASFLWQETRSIKNKTWREDHTQAPSFMTLKSRSVVQLCVTSDGSQDGSHPGILLARVLQWIPFPSPIWSSDSQI